jgi:Rad3-related DNA helicase
MLRQSIFGDILLVAVAGEVGEILKAVAVVGPCLPALTLEQQLLKDYYQERFEKGFENSFVVPGMTRVVQAAGRLIRSPRDTGVIALFDQRFLHAPYWHHLPPDWLPEEGVGTLVATRWRWRRSFFGCCA